MKKSEKAPVVSILLPVYNAERYLAESIDSILRQTYQDFELIIINDGSTDNSQKIIDRYISVDSRVISIKHKNSGLVATLNKGIKNANGRYIARIDADDPWFDDKLAKQIKLLEEDDALVLVGGGFEIIDEDGYFIETIFPLTRDEDIRRTMMLRNPFGHAGVVFRKKTAISAGLYSDQHGPTEDYELWIRLSQYGRITNIPEPVYRYRISLNGISQSNSERQALETKKHISKLWSNNPHPRILTRREILTQSNRYINMFNRPQFGIALKEQFLSDNAQIGIKFIRHGHIKDGILQLIAVASSGRTGLKAVGKRFKILSHNSAKNIFN